MRFIEIHARDHYDSGGKSVRVRILTNPATNDSLPLKVLPPYNLKFVFS